MSEKTSDNPLTVVLVHGAFADASCWNAVLERLQPAGFEVAAPPPTRCVGSLMTRPTSLPS
jgi:hypothetical protein